MDAQTPKITTEQLRNFKKKFDAVVAIVAKLKLASASPGKTVLRVGYVFAAIFAVGEIYLFFPLPFSPNLYHLFGPILLKKLEYVLLGKVIGGLVISLTFLAGVALAALIGFGLVRGFDKTFTGPKEREQQSIKNIKEAIAEVQKDQTALANLDELIDDFNSEVDARKKLEKLREYITGKTAASTNTAQHSNVTSVAELTKTDPATEMLQLIPTLDAMLNSMSNYIQESMQKATARESFEQQKSMLDKTSGGGGSNGASVTIDEDDFTPVDPLTVTAKKPTRTQHH
jgi:hypothetical protein